MMRRETVFSGSLVVRNRHIMNYKAQQIEICQEIMVADALRTMLGNPYVQEAKEQAAKEIIREKASMIKKIRYQE